VQGGGPLLTLILLGVVFYFFLIAPQRRRARQLQQMTSRLEPGTEVMTTAGLFATVRSVGDTDVELEVAPGVVSRYAKGAIARIIPPDEPDEDDGDPADETADPADGDVVPGEGLAGTDPDPGRVHDGEDDGPTARP
jgi:preprotein translocase subunit YajC